MQNRVYLPTISERDFEFNEHQFLPACYVDKTAIIAKLIQQKKICSLCRPRRFGKTSTLLTIAELFQNGLSNFQDCAIAKNGLWTDSKSYKVLFFSFAGINCSSYQDFKVGFYKAIIYATKSLKIHLKEEQQNSALLIQEIFHELAEQKLVVLIDEYDLPFIKTLDNPELYVQIQNDLANFYEMLKNHAQSLKFMMVSGVNRISNISIFSGFNNISDISFEHDYASIVGYTEQELLDTFLEPLTKIASFYDLTLTELIQCLKEHYNGYCFDQTLSLTVFNTWDINKFLTQELINISINTRFPCFWLNDGALSQFVINYFAQGSHQKDLLEAMTNLLSSKTSVSLKQLSEKKSFIHTKLEVFLFNAGYLTLSDRILSKHIPQDNWSLMNLSLNSQTNIFAEEETIEERFILDFPNKQVKSFVLDSLIEAVQSFIFNNTSSKLSANQLTNNVLTFFDLATSKEQRQHILSSIIISSGVCASDCFRNEAQLRTLLTILFKASGLQVRFEVSIVGDRIDLLVLVEDELFIIELKVFKFVLNEQKDNIKELLRLRKNKVKEAWQQMLKQQYHLVIPPNRPKHLMVIVGNCNTAEITDVELKTYV